MVLLVVRSAICFCACAFTIHREVPTAASKFHIAANAPIIEFESIPHLVRYWDERIEFQP